MKFIANNFKEPLRFPAMKGGHMPGPTPPPPPPNISRSVRHCNSSYVPFRTQRKTRMVLQLIHTRVGYSFKT